MAARTGTRLPLTHQLEIYNTGGVPLYHLIFATDSEPGLRIMTHLFDQPAGEFPAMSRAARSLRDRHRQEALGQFDLFSTLDPEDQVL